MVQYTTVVGSVSDMVASLERRLAEYEQNGIAVDLLQRNTAAAMLHCEVHGPEDQNWCPTCNTNWPCPTRRALTGVGQA